MKNNTTTEYVLDNSAIGKLYAVAAGPWICEKCWRVYDSHPRHGCACEDSWYKKK